MADKTERFLERVTAGLATDPELRLDVQAELRSHVADKLAELGGEEHAEEAVASLGEVVELAEEVAAANQRRLGWRALARRVVRFGLVPAAVLCALWFADFSILSSGMPLQALEMLRYDSGFTAPGSPGAALATYLRSQWSARHEWQREWSYRVLDWFASGQRSPHEREVPAQTDVASGGSAPTSAGRIQAAVHVADFMRVEGRTISEAFARYGRQTQTERERQAVVIPAFELRLGEAEAADPDNGYYPFLAAGLRAAQASAYVLRDVPSDEFPPPPRETVLVVNDQAAYDTAMADLLAALAMPGFRYYPEETDREWRERLGPPQRMADTVARMAAEYRLWAARYLLASQSCDYAMQHARDLFGEGHKTEAKAFLMVPEELGIRLREDSPYWAVNFLGRAARESPPVLREWGMEGEAQAMEERWQAAFRTQQSSLQQQQARVQRENLERFLGERGGWLDMSVGLVGDLDAARLPEQAAISRRLETTVLAEFGLSLLSLLMLAAMLVCAVVAWRWQWQLGQQSAPLLLLPSWQELARIVLLGIVVPLVGFQLWTRWLPFSGHAYNSVYAGHRVAAEFVALGAMLLLLPTWLATRAFRRRCESLELTPLLPLPRVLPAVLVLAAGLLAVGYCQPLGTVEPLLHGLRDVGLALIAFALVATSLLVLALVASGREGRTVGTLSRSLVPVFASAMLLLNLVELPLLRWEERHLVQADTFLWYEPVETPATKERTERLREKLRMVVGGDPMPASNPAPTGGGR